MSVLHSNLKNRLLVHIYNVWNINYAHDFIKYISLDNSNTQSKH